MAHRNVSPLTSIGNFKWLPTPLVIYAFCYYLHLCDHNNHVVVILIKQSPSVYAHCRPSWHAPHRSFEFVVSSCAAAGIAGAYNTVASFSPRQFDYSPSRPPPPLGPRVVEGEFSERVWKSRIQWRRRPEININRHFVFHGHNMTRGRPAQDIAYIVYAITHNYTTPISSTHHTLNSHTRYKPPPHPSFDPSPRLQPFGPMCIVLCRLDKLSRPRSKRLTAAVTIYIYTYKVYSNILYIMIIFRRTRTQTFCNSSPE